MEITTAISSDIPQLCLLLDSLFAQEAEFKPDHEAQSLGLSAIIDNAETGDIIVAHDAGQIIGMINLLYTVSTALGARVAILEDMVVSDTYRDKGVGSKLLKYALEFAKSQGCQRVTLLTDEDNVGAHRFYERHNFERSTMVPFRWVP
jgi:GNAT superfamily N-acetyltransferase